MVSTMLLSLLTAAPLITASPLNKKAVIDDCLSAASVPYNEKGSSEWEADGSPFNVRIPYVPVSIAVPLTTEHIQAAIKCGRDNGVKVTPKCGGHSYANFGFGGEDGHLMLELDHMYNVTLNNATGIATVQAGSRLGHVASELYKQGGKAISHGTCPGVGSAGHVLHGGYGMSSHTKGLALDWLVGAKVVLANSTVVIASETENADLFWALKGAGSSLGVATEFYFKTFDAPQQATNFLAVLQWDAQKSIDGFKVLQDWAEEDMPRELNMRLFITPRFTNLEGMFYGNKTGLQAILDPLLTKSGGKLTTSQTTDWVGNLQHFGNGLALDQKDTYKKAKNFYSSSLYTDKLSDAQIESFVNYWYGAGKALKRDWWVQVDLHGGKNSAITAIPANSSAYAHRNKLLLYQFYDRVDLSATYPEDGFSFLQGFRANTTLGMEPEEQGMYFNYPDPNMRQDEAQTKYWGDNLARLQAIKAAFDPTEVFYFPQSVRPATPVEH
ncbi:FAD-linked oxidoreductase azaL [Colletotrichum gloeosporioides]|uniref:FAD-linked oxidoreductase azaL n=1 Tax=Colletotrichum gloeosporioides TaxID=474922 RepID=A0A8H4CT88_COLGL|nr:FAD-linked oxidoreductase azaL [Colletotrichum gloeosporioides]KAF3809542.1 FAD-linked oxidoreductase azaL [Colletotrichum gloeosporioides]